LAALISVLLAQSATASHLRPKGATPLVAPLVIAYDQCTTGNSEHNPPHLAGNSCVPPTRSSSLLTTCEPTVNACPVAFRGQIKLVVTLAPNDIKILPDPAALTGSGIQDVRCGDLTGSLCSNANDLGPPDYTGFLAAYMTWRMTDHDNGPSGGPYDQTGTVQDLFFPIPFVCSSTGPSVGATCVPPATTANAICACISSSKRVNTELNDVRVFDGGTDGNPFNVSDGPNRVFARMGLFWP
jgi:hypothetical protein